MSFVSKQMAKLPKAKKKQVLKAAKAIIKKNK